MRAAQQVLAKSREGGGVILLTGAPGTGKTTTAGYIASMASAEVAGLAFDHVAACVLGKAMSRPAFTLKQWLGALPQGFNAEGYRELTYGHRLADLPPPEMIIVDDVSMPAGPSSMPMLDQVLDYAREKGIFTLLTADPEWLPTETPKRQAAFWADIPRIHLDRNERSGRPELDRLSNHLREGLKEADPLTGLTPYWDNRKRAGWQYAKPDDLPRLFAALEDATIIAFSNEAVERHNRNAIQFTKGRIGIPPFDEGDVLIGYQNRKPREEDPVTYQITDAWRYRVVERSERSQHHSIPGYRVTLFGLEDEKTHQIFLVPCQEALAAKMFARQCARRYEKARLSVESSGKEEAWNAFQGWRDEFVLLGNAADQPFANKDLDFSYCLPEAKTRGRTLDYALVDCSDLEKIRRDQGDAAANRMLYAAVSRAGKGVLLGR